MRIPLCLLFSLFCLSATAQLSVANGSILGADAGAGSWGKEQSHYPTLTGTVRNQLNTSPRYLTAALRPPTKFNAAKLTPNTFDFTRTAPHLAFFCRLEINESAGHVIPMKFRLGGHTSWQNDLLRR